MAGDDPQPRWDSRRDADPNGAGTNAGAADGDAGVVNPHIPRFIAKAPWYLNATPGLQHQRAHEQRKSQLEGPSQRGVTSRVAIKYRKNACENCGAITHDAKSCVERPRKKGAKFTNANICPDEYIVQNNAVGYDAVRDRWAGFDASAHQELVELHQAAEEEQRRRKMQQLAAELKAQTDGAAEAPSEPRTGDFAESEATFGTTDDRTRTTTRNLRIREDTAKYLINLNVDSAHYDPKSRSLRDDPLLGLANPGHHTFRGDNELFTAGDASKPKEIEQFAWEAQRRGAAVSFIAQPTELEFMFKEDSLKRQKEKEANRKALLERYGGSEFIESSEPVETGPPPEATSDPPQPLESLPVSTLRVTSSYEEDVHPLGHTAVWGSYYDRATKRWGYGCCKSTAKTAPCALN
ncbi:pre-mRNA-splicing factor Slu7 [Babesia caballi]|uniref:Pre-mRNA-splicing factor SLU7 n=1 Tax=Babesia caballi TaxID=5871 RepID=A0AAV4LY84_BABCB|nr:pre-mRNA-splicing factor Slu7 [Babesia caballi]